MAMICGHYEPDKQKKLDRAKADYCPVCPGSKMKTHMHPVPHGFCACCMECWTLWPDALEVRAVIHA